MHLAVLVTDRHVFAGSEGVSAEAVAALVVVLRPVVVVEPPTRVRAARGMNQAADLVGLAVPEAADPAMVPVLAPQLQIDMAGRIERRDELVAVTRRSRRMLLRARKVEPDALEHMR